MCRVCHWGRSRSAVEGRKGGSRYDKDVRDAGKGWGDRVSCRWLGVSERWARVWVQKRGLGPRVLGNSPSNVESIARTPPERPPSRSTRVLCSSLFLFLSLSLSLLSLLFLSSSPSFFHFSLTSATSSYRPRRQHSTFQRSLASGTHNVAVKFQNPRKVVYFPFSPQCYHHQYLPVSPVSLTLFLQRAAMRGWTVVQLFYRSPEG